MNVYLSYLCWNPASDAQTAKWETLGKSVMKLPQQAPNHSYAERTMDRLTILTDINITIL